MHKGFLAIAAILTVWAIVGFAANGGWTARKLQPRIAAPVYIIIIVVAVAASLLAATRIATRPDECPSDANRRFGAQAGLAKD